MFEMMETQNVGLPDTKLKGHTSQRVIAKLIIMDEVFDKNQRSGKIMRIGRIDNGKHLT